MLRNEKKNSFKRFLKKKLYSVNYSLNFFLRFPYKTMLKIFFLGGGSILSKKNGLLKKKIVRENPHHAPKMINGRPLNCLGQTGLNLCPGIQSRNCLHCVNSCPADEFPLSHVFAAKFAVNDVQLQ